MARQVFMQELQRLQDEVLAMGSTVEYALGDAVKILRERDFEASRTLMANDWQINVRYHDIEQGCLQLIATQQPTAGDLRVIASMITIASELERIGDYAKGVAKINLLIGNQPLIKPLVDIPQMSAKAQSMLHRSLVAFSRRDLALAKSLPSEDDEVDAMYNQVYRELFTYMLANPQTIEQGNYLLWVAHNIERSADRVTNICERVIYMITGQIVELEHAMDENDELLVAPLSLSQIVPVDRAS